MERDTAAVGLPQVLLCFLAMLRAAHSWLAACAAPAKVPCEGAVNPLCRDNGAGLECTHFCVPSAPQLWLFMLYETLRKVQGQPAAAPA
jgi:hypothetical protein